jgi:S-adenosylmethionine:tRNA ribosyltransferase-isomerase
VSSLASHFEAGELLVLNETRVRPGRAFGRKESGARLELLVLERRWGEGGEDWLALVRSSRSPRAGSRLLLDDGPAVEVLGRERELFRLRPEPGAALAAWLESHGRMPLPPYIRRDADAEDSERYQTTFAAETEAWSGAEASAAAPTAGLHLPPGLLAELESKGVNILRLSLGVGVGTFRPVQAERLEDHRMHEEPFQVPATTAEALNAAFAEGRRVTAVGTTTLRSLEAATSAGGRVRAGAASTGLYLMPGCRFRTAQRLLTNFHQPRSSLLALVQGFAGRETIRAAYREAVAEGYRLFSYGDCMLLERSA